MTYFGTLRNGFWFLNDLLPILFFRRDIFFEEFYDLIHQNFTYFFILTVVCSEKRNFHPLLSKIIIFNFLSKYCVIPLSFVEFLVVILSYCVSTILKGFSFLHRKNICRYIRTKSNKDIEKEFVITFHDMSMYEIILIK